MEKNEWLSRTECSALRGIAILGIMLHNYCHWLAMATKENEFTFNTKNISDLSRAFANADMYIPVHLLSFFGHYGVPIFLFLSGFGLVMKYERGDEPPAWGFIRHHYAKLFGMMISGFVAFVVVDAITPGTFRYHSGNIIAQLLMYINLLPEPNRIIWPGPYWFFGLMLQLYIVYRLLIYRRHWSIIAALVAICWIAQIACEPQGDLLNRLRYNCVGGIMPFCAGILLARCKPGLVLVRLSAIHWAVIALAATGLTYLLSLSFTTWLWAPLLVIIASVAFAKLLPSGALRALGWVGGISAAIFIVHPILRKIFIPISHRGDIYDGLTLYVVTTIALAWMFKKSVMSKL